MSIEEAVTATDSDGVPCRLFLADDVEGIRVLWRYLFEAEADFVVVGEAADGDAALDGIAATDPDVVVLDLSMPGRDGMEVLKVLRELDPDLPVVVVASAFAAVRLEALALELGAAAYFEKGKPGAELLDAVRTACRSLDEQTA